MIPTRILFQIHDLRRLLITKLQNSPYFCIFKYAQAVKQKVCNEAESRDPDWGRLGRGAFFFLASHDLWAYKARALHARKTLTPRFTDFFTDFEKKTRLFCSLFDHLFIERFSQWLRSFVLYSFFGVQTSLFIQNYVDFGSLFLCIIIRFVHVWSFL